MSESLGALLRSLQLAGVSMDAGSAMDSLWLALRMRERGALERTVAPETVTDDDARPGEPEGGRPRPGRPASPAARPASTATGAVGGTTRFALADAEVDALDTTEGRWLTLERTEALSMGRELSRALRPLRRRVQVPGRGRLDVDATVRRVIDEFVFIPTFSPARERWLDVLLVLDHGLSMMVWKETLDAFERVLRTSGAFRSLRTFWLESDLATPVLTSRSGGSRVRDAVQLPALAHARSRTVVLVVTDCVGRRWHEGTLPGLLAAWGSALPVSLLQVTPDWYWPRTALGDAVEGPLFASRELTRNARLTWSSAAMGLEGLLPGEAGPFAPVPLAAMTAHDIGRLARLLAGGGDGGVRGALFDLSWRGAEEDDSGQSSAQSRVARFHALATAEARRLASAFASSPVQTLGMLRLLRRDLLPGSRPFVEAEVLLGGILRARAEDPSWDAGAALRLEFIDGVRPLLQDSSTVPDILRVLRHASRDAATGGSATFSAWLSKPELEESGLEELGEEFAGAAAPMLRRLGGAYARGAQRVAERSSPAMGANAPVFEQQVDEPIVSAEDPASRSAAARPRSVDGSPSSVDAPPQAVEAHPPGAAAAERETRIRRARSLDPAPHLVGRDREVQWLLAATTGGPGTRRRVQWVRGAEGIGKSAALAALIEQWNQTLLRSALNQELREGLTTSSAFYWSFASWPSVDDCLRVLTDVVSESNDGTAADPSELRAALLGALVRHQQNLLVFDAVEALAPDDRRLLMDTVSLITGSSGASTAVVLASRNVPDHDRGVSELHLEPLSRAAVEELVQVRVREGSAVRPPSLSFTESARAQALASTDLLAALSGGNPQVLLSLLGLMAQGLTADALRERFAAADGVPAALSATEFGLANIRIDNARDVQELLDRAEEWASEGEFAEAVGLAERALGIAQQLDPVPPGGGELAARAMQAIGKLQLRLGNREEGIRQLQRALRTAADAGATSLVASLREFLDDRAPRFDDPQVQAVFHVYGRLSGVFFRTWAQQQARELQLEGSAENLPDGRVRVTASGPQSGVDVLEQRLRTGPPGAIVSRVTREGENIASAGADVFLSYAATDRLIATRLGELLEGQGFSVFINQASLEGGDGWRQALDAALDRARCVVMLLSHAAVTSDWVLRESRRGLQRQILVPVLLEPNVPVPVELNEMSLCDFTRWDRSDASPDFRALLAAIVSVVGVRSTPEPSQGVASEAGSAAVETGADTPDDEVESPRAESAPPPEVTDEASVATPSFDLETLDLTDLDGPGWVQLAAATFRMGSSEGEERERPEHVVGCSAFRISRFPVTNRQYDAFLKDTGLAAPEHWRSGRLPYGTRDKPVTNVTWDDAAAFCSWLTSQVASRTGGRVLLPTEAQWEFAARGTEGRRYPWGHTPPSREHANFGGRGEGIEPVNAHPAGVTPSGIWDMTGNAWEWCRDWYGPYPSETVEDPTGAAKGTVRVIRGGSHRSEAGKLRAAYRANRPPDETFDRCGFRIVWSEASGKGPVAS